MKIHKQITEIKESPLFMKLNPTIETRLPPIKLFSNAGEEFLEMSYDLISDKDLELSLSLIEKLKHFHSKSQTCVRKNFLRKNGFGGD